MKIGATSRKQEAGFAEVDSEKLIKHEKYSPEQELDFDIGLIKLKRGISDFGMFENGDKMFYHLSYELISIQFSAMLSRLVFGKVLIFHVLCFR